MHLCDFHRFHFNIYLLCSLYIFISIYLSIDFVVAVVVAVHSHCTTIFISRKYAINVAYHRSGRQTETIQGGNGNNNNKQCPSSYVLHHLDRNITREKLGNANNDEEGQMGISFLFLVAHGFGMCIWCIFVLLYSHSHSHSHSMQTKNPSDDSKCCLQRSHSNIIIIFSSSIFLQQL